MSTLHRLIHGGCRHLGINADDRRGMYLRLVKKDTLSDMNDEEMQVVADELRRLGYRQGASKASGREGKRPLSGKYLPKLRALWIALYNLGVIADRRDSAMEAFVLGRQVKGVHAVQFVHAPGDGKAAIEGMKKMAERAGVDWSSGALTPAYAAADGFKIAWAQWIMLGGEVHATSVQAFWAEVESLSGETGKDISRAGWIKVMNGLGYRVRALKTKGGA
ncbi:MAG: GemA protein [Stutzerimonas stutzeri]|nr:MAG: GemA protein [Stutzerimonas stutzeri]